jgi:hypothetical protein
LTVATSEELERVKFGATGLIVKVYVTDADVVTFDPVIV